LFSVFTTETFDSWLSALLDARGKARILTRIRSAELGNLGDSKSIGEGVSEMRIHHGPGYRVYFTMIDRTLVVLLVGGDKSSQKRDIKKAVALAKEVRNDYDQT
jgi:putative addiction module killer protein